MAKKSTKAVVKTAPKSKAQVVKAELLVTDAELSYDDIWQFVNEHAGGNDANVYIQPLDNVKLDDPKPLPFGYGGQSGGVRQTIQDWMLRGIDGSMSLRLILDKSAKLGHSKKRPNCLHALMHGGYSPSSKTWMTPYIKLVVKG